MKHILCLAAITLPVIQALCQQTKDETREEPSVEVVMEEPVVFEVVTQDSEKEIYTVVEESSSPKIGINELKPFFAKNIRYPKKAKKKKIEGTVFVQFIVGKDGTLNDFQIVKTLDKECDAEAINVIKKTGNWNPGKQRGKPVNQRMVLPVRFKLDAADPDKKKKK
jgi:periplasmic protein TonB